MGNILVIQPSRGTKLYRNRESKLKVEIGAQEYINQIEILVLQGKDVSIQKIDIRNNRIQFLPNQEFLLVNLSSVSVTLKFSVDTDTFEVVFDPYAYEKSHYDKILPEEFTQSHSIPEGYVDILSKWYSIKFTYPKKNLIFIRPHLGISIQSHTKRTEDWVIVQGHPIIIANSKVHYSVKPGDEFHTDQGNIHAIFNPTDNWVAIEETYSGIFEEEDIVRIFNPNHYE